MPRARTIESKWLQGTFTVEFQDPYDDEHISRNVSPSHMETFSGIQRPGKHCPRPGTESKLGAACCPTLTSVCKNAYEFREEYSGFRGGPDAN